MEKAIKSLICNSKYEGTDYSLEQLAEALPILDIIFETKENGTIGIKEGWYWLPDNNFKRFALIKDVLNVNNFVEGDKEYEALINKINSNEYGAYRNVRKRLTSSEQEALYEKKLAKVEREIKERDNAKRDRKAKQLGRMILKSVDKETKNFIMSANAKELEKLVDDLLAETSYVKK